MRFHRKNNLLFLTFDVLDQYPEVWHGIFTRRGGHSAPPYDGLNVGLSGSDNKTAVIKNRAAVSEIMGNHPMVYLSQVHGTHISEVDEISEGSSDNGAEADGVVTDIPGKLLGIQVADCQAVMLYDPRHRAVANVHAGWRGSIGNIIDACIAKMKHRFDTRPEDLAAVIGPSLGPCCAEFVNYKQEIPEVFWKYKDSRDHFDFWQISTDQLKTAGVPGNQIERAGICTKCNPHLFFSYRGNSTTGRFVSVIGIKP